MPFVKIENIQHVHLFFFIFFYYFDPFHGFIQTFLVNWVKWFNKVIFFDSVNFFAEWLLAKVIVLV